MASIANSGILRQSCYPSSEAPAQTIVGDVLVHGIGTELFLRDFIALTRVCSAWQKVIQPNIGKKFLKEISFGKDKWLSIPGVFSVSEEVAFTDDQEKAWIAKLKSECEFFNKEDRIQPHRFQNGKIKKTWQTQKLMFFTETINGQPRTINSQNKLFHFIKEKNNGTAFEVITGKEEDAFCNQPAPKSYWGLVTLDVIPGSRATTHDTKESLLKSKGYKVLTPNDAVTSNLIINLGSSKEKDDYFFGRKGNYWTYTATTELYKGCRLVVGAAASSGPRVTSDYADFNDVGAAGVAEVP
jgi:hypothetical protein